MAYTVLPGRTKVLPFVKGLIGLFGILVVLSGCGQRAEEEALDTPTSGAMIIGTDQSFFPIVQAEVDVFHSFYRRAKIDVVSMPEDAAIRAMIADSLRLVVVSRDLTDAEKKYFEDVKIRPRVLKLAEDGVALIVSKNNPDSLITTEQLEQIFKGQHKTWSDLRKGASGKDIAIVFDSNGSSNLNYLIRRFGIPDISKLNVFAAKSNEEVIDYVKTHDNAIGVIGTNWISDSDDPAQQRFVSEVTVMSISELKNPTPEDYYQPYQAYLSMKLYPLRRDVMVISREARTGLGAGLMSHMASVRGQRIILKSGLLPATMPVRIVGLKETF